MLSNSMTTTMLRLSANIPAGLPGADTWKADPPSAHDLRRTMATRMGKAGIPNEHIAACLNHKPAGITRVHYNHYDLANEKRAAWARWAADLGAILDPAPAKVLAFRGLPPRSQNNRIPCVKG